MEFLHGTSCIAVAACGRWFEWPTYIEDIATIAGSSVGHHLCSLSRVCVLITSFRNVLWSPEQGGASSCLLRVLFVDCGKFEDKNELDCSNLWKQRALPPKGLSRCVLTKATKLACAIQR